MDRISRIITRFLPFSILMLCIVSLIAGCSSPAPTIVEVTKEILQEITREVTVEVTRETTVEVTREITEIVLETVLVPVTVTPTKTPQFTPTITLTPTMTATKGPTMTPTKPPGIGDEFECGNKFLITVKEQPRKEKNFYRNKAQGEFWLLKLEITNLMSKPLDLNYDDFIIEAVMGGNKIEFTYNWDITFDWVYHHYGQLIYPNDDIVAGLSAVVGIGFDVNPSAENFKLVWFPRDNMFDKRKDAFCEVTIPLE